MDIQVNEKVTPSALIQLGNTQVFQAYAVPGLRAFGDLHGLQAVEGQQVYRRPQSGLADVDGHGAVQIELVTLKDGMFLDCEHYIQIARGAAVGARLAFLRQAHLRPVGDSSGNGDFQLAFTTQVAFALAFLAGTANDLASASALAATAANGKKGLLVENLAASTAGRACDQSVIGFRAFALAASALFHAGNLQVGRQASHGIFEADLQVITNVFAALSAGAALAAATRSAEHIAETEHVAENIAQIGESAGIEPAAGSSRNALMSETIVGRPLLAVAQYAIGFGSFLELFLGLMAAGIAVGMILKGEFPVGGL